MLCIGSDNSGTLKTYGHITQADKFDLSFLSLSLSVKTLQAALLISMIHSLTALEETIMVPSIDCTVSSHI